MGQRHVLLILLALIMAQVVTSHSYHDNIELNNYSEGLVSRSQPGYPSHPSTQSSSSTGSSENQEVIEKMRSISNRNDTRKKPSLTTISSNQHGLLKVSILLEHEERMITGAGDYRICKDDCGFDRKEEVSFLSTVDEHHERRPPTYHGITNDDIIWTVLVQEVQVGEGDDKPKSKASLYSQQIVFDWKRTREIEEPVVENEHYRDIYLDDESNINAIGISSSIMPVRQKTKTIHRSGNASCTFVIPIEQYDPVDVPPSSSDSTASFCHGTKTFIVSLVETVCHRTTSAAVDIGSKTTHDEPRCDENCNCHNKTSHLLTRRLASLPRKAPSCLKPPLDPVARIVLRSSQKKIHYLSPRPLPVKEVILEGNEKFGSRTDDSLVDNDDGGSSSNSDQDFLDDGRNDLLWTIILLFIIDQMRSMNLVWNEFLKVLFYYRRQDKLLSYCGMDVVDQQKGGEDNFFCCDLHGNYEEKEDKKFGKKCVCNDDDDDDDQYDQCHEKVEINQKTKQSGQKMTAKTSCTYGYELEGREYNEDSECNIRVYGSNFGHLNRDRGDLNDNEDNRDKERDPTGNDPDDKVSHSVTANVEIRSLDDNTAKKGGPCTYTHTRTKTNYVSPNSKRHNGSSENKLDLKVSHSFESPPPKSSPLVSEDCCKTSKEDAHSKVRDTLECSIRNTEAKTAPTNPSEVSRTEVRSYCLKQGEIIWNESSIQVEQPSSASKESIPLRDRQTDKKVVLTERASVPKISLEGNETNPLQKRNATANSSVVYGTLSGYKSFDNQDMITESPTNDSKRTFTPSVYEMRSRDDSTKFKFGLNSLQTGNLTEKDSDNQTIWVEDRIQLRAKKNSRLDRQYDDHPQILPSLHEKAMSCVPMKERPQGCQETRATISTMADPNSPLSLTPRGSEILTQLSDFEEHKMHSSAFLQSVGNREQKPTVVSNDVTLVQGSRSSPDQHLATATSYASVQAELKLDQSLSETKLIALQQTNRISSGKTSQTSEGEESYVSTLAPDSDYVSEDDPLQLLPTSFSTLQSQVIGSQSHADNCDNGKKPRKVPTGINVPSHDCCADSKRSLRKKRKNSRLSGPFGCSKTAIDFTTNSASSPPEPKLNESDLEVVEVVHVTMPNSSNKRCKRPYSKSNYVADWVPSNGLQSMSQDFFKEKCWEIDAPDLHTSNMTLPKAISMVPKKNKPNGVATIPLLKKRCKRK